VLPVSLDCPFLSCPVGVLWRLFDIPNTQIQDRILFWLGTDTPVINGRLNRGYVPLVVTTAHLSYFTTHHWMINKSDTTGDTNETGNTVLSKNTPPFLFCFVFLESFVLFNLYFSAKYFVDNCLSFFHWSLCCLFTPLDIFKRFLDFVLFSISFVREKKVITLLNIVLFSRDAILKRF
jgi:hypothetical protein